MKIKTLIPILFLPLAALSATSPGPRTALMRNADWILVDGAGNPASATFAAANGLATTTYADIAGAVKSVNGQVGTVSLTAANVGAMPATTSTLSLTGLTVSGGVLTVSSPSTVSGGVLRLGPLTLTSAYNTSQGMNRITIPYCQLSISAWTVFNNSSTFYGVADFSTGSSLRISAAASLSVSGPATFSQTPTISPTQWYAVFYIPAGEPQVTLTYSLVFPSAWNAVTTSGAVVGTVSGQYRGYTLQKTYWTDFELKGCTMDAGTTLNVRWKYFSFDNDAQVYPQIYTVRPDVYYFSPYFNSRTAHKLASYETSIFQRLDNDSTPASDNGVTGWVVVVKEPLGASWFNPYNVALYWTYRKSRSDTAETNAYGSEVWQPIFPIWTTQLPALSTLN